MSFITWATMAITVPAMKTGKERLPSIASGWSVLVRKKFDTAGKATIK